MQGDDLLGLGLLLAGHDLFAIGPGGLQGGDDFWHVGGAGGDRAHEVADLPFQLGEALAVGHGALGRLAVHRGAFLMVDADHGGHGLGVEQLGAQAGEDPRFERLVGHGPPIGAGAGAAGVGAAPLALRDNHHVAAALAALHQAGEDALGPDLPLEGPALVLRLHRADLIPQRLIDDAQVRHGLALPLVGRVDTRHPFPRVGIADHGGAVVDQLAHVDLVAEHAVAPHRVAVDGADVPAAAGGRGHAFGIEPAGNGERAFALDIFGEDATDHGGLIGIDFAQAPFRLAPRVEAVDLAIAIDDIPRGAAGGHAPALAALDLGGQIGAEHGGHGALEADLQFIDRPFGQGEDPRAKETDALVDAGKVFLIAGKAVNRLGHDLLGPAAADVFDQGVEAGPIAHGPGNGIVGKDGGNRPAFAFSAIGADADLILDRGVLLQLAAEAGVDCGFHRGFHGSGPSWWRWPRCGRPSIRHGAALPAYGQ